MKVRLVLFVVAGPLFRCLGSDEGNEVLECRASAIEEVKEGGIRPDEVRPEGE